MPVFKKDQIEKIPYLTIAFIIVCLINYPKEGDIYSTIGASYIGFLPINVIQIINMLYHLIVKKKFIWIKSPLFLIIPTIILIISFSSGLINKNKYSEKIEKEKSVSIEPAFKEFLKNEQISLDINKSNKYEEILEGNVYNNHKYRFTIDLPNNWKLERGKSEFSIFRCVNYDSLFVISLSAIPANQKELENPDYHQKFQEDPVNLMNQLHNGSYYAYLGDELKNSAMVTPHNLVIENRKINNVMFLVSRYKHYLDVDGVEISFISETFQTFLWGQTYTFGFECPELVYDKNLMQNVMNSLIYVSSSL